jgi:hypothetical protein
MIPTWGASFGANAIANSADLYLPLTHSAVPDKGALTPSFTRADATNCATFRDWEGVLKTVPSGCARFEGARMVRNLAIVSSENFSLAAFVTVNGGNSGAAGQITFAGGPGTYILQNGPSVTLQAGRTYVISAYITKGTKTGQLYLGSQSNSVYVTITPTITRTRYEVLLTATTNNPYCGFVNADVTTGTVIVDGYQIEDVTGQAYQGASEYVSVGVPADWAGPEHVSNGTFDSTTTGWTAVNSTIVVENAELKLQNVGVVFGYAYQAVATVVGAKYVASCLARQSTAATLFYSVGTTPAGVDNGQASTTSTTSTLLQVSFTATATTTYITTQNNNVNNGISYVDNIIVKPAIYHGSMVDGVKCYDTDRLGNPIATSVTYEAVTLNGVAGTYVSTPDSVAASITGDIDIRVKLAATAWTPAAVSMLLSKDDGAVQRSYNILLETDGRLRFSCYKTSSGGSPLAINSTEATGITDGATSWVRVTFNTATGKANFYLSSDGATWTTLGTEVSSTAQTIYNSTAEIKLGAYAGAVSIMFSGKIYQAQIYNGINGTLAVDFNASSYSGGGSTLTGSTGETWTLNGSAVIHQTNYPIIGYVPWEAQTNIALQSNAFTTTWTAAGGTPTATQNVVGPDGATSAWTVTDDDPANNEAFSTPNILLTAASYTYSMFVKKTTGVQTAYPCLWFLDAAVTAILPCTIDTTNGTATVWTAYTGLAVMAGGSARCTSYNANYWCVELTGTGTAANWTVRFGPALTTNPTQSTGIFDVAAQGSHVFYGAMVNLGAFAGPYVPTTTVAVARNADVLTYTGADVANIKTLACTFSREVGIATAGTVAALSDNTANEYSSISLTSATAVRFDGVDGGVSKWQTTASNAYTPAATSKAAYSAATNSIKMDLDGTAQTEDTVATLPTVTQVQIGHLNGATQLNGPVNHIYGWTRNLSQSELGAIDA